MDLLVFLTENQGTVVTKDEIFEAVWTDTFVGDTVLWKCISELRQVLGDDPKNPRIIVTFPKRGYRLDLPEVALEGEPSSPRMNWRAAVIVLSVLVLIFLCWWFTHDSTSQRTPLSISERPMILVAQISNRTGDAALDATLEYALENYLLRSEMVRVASQARTEEALRLAGQATNAPLNETLAREISLRDGEITAIVTGLVTKLGNEYELGVRLVGTDSGDNLFVSTSRVTEADSLIEAIREASGEIVERILALKELPRSPSPDRRIRTGSLTAFRSYLLGVESYRAGQYREAETLFGQAVEIDPEFSSAHLMLAWSYYQQGQRTETSVSAEAAMNLRDRATPAEQAFIQGCYHNWRGELEEAWSHYELLLELEPDHPWAMYQLTVTAKKLGRLDQLARLIVQSAAAAPTLRVSQERGAFILVEVLNRLDLARPLIERARAILEESPSAWVNESGWPGAWISSFGVWERWLEGDVEAALSEANRVHRWLDGKRSHAKIPLRHANFLGLQYLTLGRVKDARKLMTDFGIDGGLYLAEMTALSSATLDEELKNQLERPGRRAKAATAFRLLLQPSLLDTATADLPNTESEVPEGLTISSGSRLRRHLYSARTAIDEGRLAEAILNFMRQLVSGQRQSRSLRNSHR
jgi:tetratricopeptide (TPR) repeat protein